MTRIGVAFMLGALAACQVTEPGEELGEDVAVQEVTTAPFPYGTWNGQKAPLDEHSMQVVVHAAKGYLAAVVDTKSFQITWGVRLTSPQLSSYMAVNALGPVIGPGGGPGGDPCWYGGISGDCDQFIKFRGTYVMKALFEAAYDSY